MFFTCAFNSNDYNSLVKYDYEYILNFYRGILKKKLGRELNADVEFLLKMYCHGSIHMTVEWVRTGMKEEPETLAELLVEALPAKLDTLLSFLEERP